MKINNPIRCVIELSYRCNLACMTCNIWRDDFLEGRKLKRQMDLTQISKLHRDLSDMGVAEITYVGGEPFLNRNLGEVISDARMRGIKTAAVTNGTMLDGFVQSHDFDALPDVIILSLDGPRKIHDRIRGKSGTFDLAIANIQNIQKIRKKRKRTRPRIFLYVTVSSFNVQHIPDMFDIARKLDVNALRFQTVTTIGRQVLDATNRIFEKEVIGVHSYDVNTELALAPHQIRMIRVMLEGSIEWSRRMGIGLMTEEILKNGESPSTCRFIQQSLVVNPAGDILPCPMMTGYVIGNTGSQSIQKIWGNNSHRRFLDTFQDFCGFPICSRCCVEKLPDAGVAIQ